MSNKQNEIDLLINSFLNTLKSTEQIEELLIEYMKNYPKTQKQLKFSLLQALSSIVDKYIQQIKNPQKNLSQIYLENLFFPSFRDKINIKSSYFKEEDRILIEIGIKIATQNTEWMDLILNSAIKMLSENSQEQQFENPDKINYQITASSNIINKILNFFLNSKKNPLSLIPNLTLQKIEGFESIIFEEAMKFVNLSNSKAQIIVFQLIIAHFITQNLFKDKITQILDSVITSENKHTQECAVNLISVAFDIYFTCDSSERDEKFLKLNESVILSHPNAFARKKCLKIHQKFVQLRMEHLDSKEYLSWNEEQWKIYFFLLQNIESSSIYILNEYWNRITLLFNPNYYSLRKEKPEQKIPENSPETIKLILLLFGRGFKTDKTKSFTVYLFLTSFNTGINSPDIDNFILQEVIPNLIDKLILKKKKAEIKQVILNFLLSFYQNNIRKRNTQEQQAFLLKFLNEIIQKLDSPKILDVYFDFFVSIDKIDLLDTEFAIKFCRFADAIEWLPNHLQSQMSIKYLKSFLHLVKLETLDFNCFSLFLESLSKVSTQFSKNKQAGQIIYKWIQENDSKIQQHSWIYSAISHQIHHFIQNQIPFHEQNYLVQRISRAIQFVSEQNLLLILDNFGKYLGKENKSSEKILANYDQSLRIVQIFNVLMPFFLVNNQQKTQLANYLSFFSDNYNLFIEDIFTNKDQNQAAQHCEIITNFITNLSSFYQNEEQLKQDIFQFSQKTLELVILKAKEFSSKSSFEIINLLHSLIHSSNNIPALLNYNSKDLSEEIFSILIDLMPINLPKLKFTNAYNQFSKMKSELLVIFLNISQTSKFRNQELTKISKDIHELLDEVSDRESLNSLIQCLSEIWAYNAEEFMKNENENENLIENIKRIFDHGLEKSQELKNLRPFSFFIFQPKYFKYSIMQPVLKSYFELIHKKTLQMKGFANSLATTFLNALLQIEDDSITTQFIPEIIQIIFFADVTRKKQRNPFRFMEKQYSRKEPMDENCTDKLRFIMETTNKEYVMGLLAIFTMKKCSKAKQNEKSQRIY
ncbi:hypothetical protein M0811_09206 [Anaeramoeba ignava]|uniref:Uncharacterized protein n=1 Tax=Anaeramoeba ignava TaxID=1746090 RepID=A0A9Q0LHI9_ANAIG|nr:hypothetical protein M0811_09206 [Anaeramoeba ignava]